MAKPPSGQLPSDPDFIQKVEDWLDPNIPDDVDQFMILRESVKRQFPTITNQDWEQLEIKYRAAGWKIVSSTHWVSRENDGGPYFYLSKY